MSEACPTKTHDWSQSRTLYVVLQGEFALYRKPSGYESKDDTLLIAAPAVEGHVYKAGPWLSDWKNDPNTDLPGKYLKLENAFGDRKTGDPSNSTSHKHHSARSIPENDTDVIMSLGREAPDTEKARLVISAPMPLAILPGLTETTPSVQIEVTNPGSSPDPKYSYPPIPSNPTVIPILVYKWYDGSPPYLYNADSHNADSRRTWPSSGPSGPQDYFQSIQIYATSETPEDDQHAKDAFAAAAALLGVQATIDWKTDHDHKNCYYRIPATPPAGLSFAQVNWFLYQFYNLPTNDRRLILDELPLSELEDPLVSANSGNCGPIGGGH
jgi:hypothetical protein